MIPISFDFGGLHCRPMGTHRARRGPCLAHRDRKHVATTCPYDVVRGQLRRHVVCVTKLTRNRSTRMYVCQAITTRVVDAFVLSDRMSGPKSTKCGEAAVLVQDVDRGEARGTQEVELIRQRTG